MPEQRLQAERQEVLPDHPRDLQPAHCPFLSAREYDQNQISGVDLALEQSASRASNAMTVIGFIDGHSFTRECIAASLQAAAADFRLLPYARCADVIESNMQHDLLLFHWHCEDKELASMDYKALTSLAPIIVLGAIEQSEFVSDTFEKGAHGYIPLRSTTLGLTIEIIRLVKAGGTFVPLSSLPLRRARVDSEAAGVSASGDLTMRERAVLKFLKQGKAKDYRARVADK